MSCPYFDQYEEKCKIVHIEPKLSYLTSAYIEYNCSDNSERPHYTMCYGYKSAKLEEERGRL